MHSIFVVLCPFILVGLKPHSFQAIALPLNSPTTLPSTSFDRTDISQPATLVRRTDEPIHKRTRRLTTPVIDDEWKYEVNRRINYDFNEDGKWRVAAAGSLSPKYRMRNGEVYNDETIDLVWKMDVEYRFRCWLEVNGGKTRVSITSSDGVQTLWASELPSLKDGISITPKPSIQPHEGRGVHLNLKVLTKPEEDVQPTELRYQVVTRRAAGDPPEPVEEGPSSDAPWSSEVPTSVMWGPLETDDGIESSFLSSGIELNSAPHASPLEKPVAHSGSPPDSPSGSPPDSPFWSTISSSSSDSGSQAGTPGSSSGGPPKRPLLGPMASSFRIPGRSSSSPAGSSVSGGGGHQPITEEDLSARLVAHETLDDLEEDDLDGPPSFQ